MPSAILASVVAALVTMAGVFAMRSREHWARANKTYFISFAAGVLIAASLLHLIPESFALTRRAAPGLFAGFFLLHFLDRFITTKVCDRPEEKARALGLVPLVGIGFHSFLDGIAYSVGFSVAPMTGLLMALGMVLHEFPEGVMTYSLLLAGGYGQRRAIVLTLIAAAFTTPLGTILSYPLVDQLEPQTLGLLLSVSAGALLYVGASHLLPQIAGARDRFTWLALAGGVAVAAAVTVAG